MAGAVKWTPDPARWTRGDWEYHPGDWKNDATRDAPWEDPQILRRRIGTPEELAAVADAIVRGQRYRREHPTDAKNPYDIIEEDPDGNPRLLVGMVWDALGTSDYGLSEYVIVEDLKALIEAVQNHPDVRLASVETEEDEDGLLRVTRRFVSDRDGVELPDGEKPTELLLWHTIIARTAAEGENYREFDIGVTLGLHARFAGDADFGGTRFAGDASFGFARFAGAASFRFARFAGYAPFWDARFAGDAHFGGARFAGDASFGFARFAGAADFREARFVGYAVFRGAHFAKASDFQDARFARATDFLAACFGGDAYFGSARFAGEADFEATRFAGAANFWRARFAGEADFGLARFGGEADFGLARFAGDTSFGGAHFAEDIDFFHACFGVHAYFTSAHFAGHVTFWGTRFRAFASFDMAVFGRACSFRDARFVTRRSYIRALAQREQSKTKMRQSGLLLKLCEAYPVGSFSFNDTRFEEDADFSGIWLSEGTPLEFIGARFAGRVRFDCEPNQAASGEMERAKPRIRGKIFFTDATLDERMSFAGTRFGPSARLGFNRFLARGGATVELTRQQLRLDNPGSWDQPFKRIGAKLRHWLWFYDRPRAIMEGADSTDPDPIARATAIERAAGDYELLAVNYARQPATDPEEDGCRWMARELYRVAGRIRTWRNVVEKWRRVREAWRAAKTAWRPDQREGRDVKQALVAPIRFGAAFLRWFGALIWWLLEHVIGRWLIQRTMIGYLLESWRPLVAGGIVIVICAAIYGFGAGPGTIHYTNDPNRPTALWDAHPVGNALYFSVVTFTSLGYGDIQPLGCFKFLAASEALAGLTLMALFTVSWARKMVR